MSTFVPVHDSVWTHRKTLLLAADLDLSPMAAASHMIRLWHWTVENAPDGFIGHLPAHVVATAAHYPGDADRFSAGMEHSGFLDPGGCLHNWFERNGRLIQKRRDKRDYMRRRRAEESAAPETETSMDDPETDHAPEPARDHHVPPTEPARAAEQYSTVQNSTEQKSTEQEPVVVVVRAGARKTRDSHDDDDRPTYESDVLETVRSEEPELLQVLLGPLPCRDTDDLILLARVIWIYPLVDLVHEAQRMRARYKRAPASWPCAFDDWLREGRSVRFLDGRMDQARHGTRRYLPQDEEEYDCESEFYPDEPDAESETPADVTAMSAP